MRSIHPFRTFALLASLVAVGAGAQAQTRWAVDPKASLAWWQISPHLNHLWATTCPEEPSWRPGEGRSAGWIIDGSVRSASKTGFQNVADTVNVPLYPRPKVHSVCTEAVEGVVLVADTVTWRVLRGAVDVKTAKLVTGESRRDAYARSAILHSDRYPHVRFTVDSIVGMTRQADTLRGTALGVLSLHGATKPMTAAVRAWPEGGGMRVLAKVRVPARELVPEYGMSKFALGLGIGTKIWQDLFMGVDLLLRQQAASGS
jgi:polyisoprenoid-binding protein YceI